MIKDGRFLEYPTYSYGVMITKSYKILFDNIFNVDYVDSVNRFVSYPCVLPNGIKVEDVLNIIKEQQGILDNSLDKEKTSKEIIDKLRSLELAYKAFNLGEQSFWKTDNITKVVQYPKFKHREELEIVLKEVFNSTDNIYYYNHYKGSIELEQNLTYRFLSLGSALLRGEPNHSSQLKPLLNFGLNHYQIYRDLFLYYMQDRRFLDFSEDRQECYYQAMLNSGLSHHDLIEFLLSQKYEKSEIPFKFLPKLE